MTAMPPKVDSKHALLVAAKKVFAEKGFEGATVKDLADEAGVNVSLVSYHFGGKEGLYRECVLQFASARTDAIARILKAPTSISELRVRLRLFADEMVDVHVREPDLCKIIHRDAERMTAVGEEMFRQSFYPLFLNFVDFLRSAEKAKLTKKFKNHDHVATLVFGSLMHLLHKEQHRKMLGLQSIREDKFREEILSLWTDMSLAALGTPSSESQES